MRAVCARGGRELFSELRETKRCEFFFFRCDCDTIAMRLRVAEGTSINDKRYVEDGRTPLAYAICASGGADGGRAG